jgi:flagellar hook-associated protein 2
MPAIQSLGVGSGLDANSIVTQLMAVERRPLTLLQKSASGIQSQISVYGNIKSRLDALQTATDKIKLSTNWSPVKVDTAGSTAVSASVSGSPAAGDFTVGVSQLARAQSVATAPFASATAAVGTGTLRIELGQWSGGFGTFSATAGASVDVAVDATTGSSLTNIRDAVNSAISAAKAAKLAGTRTEAVPDVSATIVTDSNGSRLVLQSGTTGEANGFRITDASTPPATGSFSSLLFNPPSGATMPVANAASNLQATVNGVPVSLAGNTMTDVVQGITIQANSVTTTDTRIKVTQDTEALKKGISDFISAYNEVIKYTTQQTAYDATTKKGGPLQGDRSALSLLNQLRQAVTTPTSATTAFSGATGQASRLSDVGITVQRDGTLQSDSTKLDKALVQLPELTKLFSQVNTTDASQQGIGQGVARLLTSLTGMDGSLSARQSGLNASLTRNQNDQTRINDRLAQVEARLRAQYTALDKRMAGINGLGSYISALGG